jgi:hypothetical protein
MRTSRVKRLFRDQHPNSVQKLQTALHAKAKAEVGYRFYALYDKIFEADLPTEQYAPTDAMGPQTDSRAPQQTLGRAYPAVSFEGLSIERTFNKFYGIICHAPKISRGRCSPSRNERICAALFRGNLLN